MLSWDGYQGRLMMEMIPCKDCITLAICLGNVKPKYSGTALMGHIDNNLMNKCALLRKYIYENNDHSSGFYHREVDDGNDSV